MNALLVFLVPCPAASGTGGCQASVTTGSFTARQVQVRFEVGGWKPYAVVMLFCLALYGAGLTTLPPVDRDEARFAQATRQMIEERDFVRIRFQAEARHKKPIGIYWLQAAAVAVSRVAGDHEIWPYRLPSLLGGALAAVLTLALGRRLFDAPTAYWGALLTASSLLLTVEAHLATTDAMLLASVVAAQGALGNFYVRARCGQTAGLGMALAFWVAQGIGLLLKGPVLVLISALTIAALSVADRNVRWLKGLHWGWGLGLVCVMVSPWAIAVDLATHGAFFHDAFSSDLLPKLLSGQESHGFPPGYYLLALPVTLWPSSLFVGLGLFGAWKWRGDAGVRFCLAWLVPTWIVFELIPTKLPHYILPTYPALALLSARAISGSGPGGLAGLRWWWVRLGFAGWALIGLGFALAVLALPWWIEQRFDPWALWPALAAVATSVLAVWQAWSGRLQTAATVTVLGALFTLAPLVHAVLPRIQGLWLSRAVAQGVSRHAPTMGGTVLAVAASGFDEPSLVFLLGTSTQLLSPQQAAGYLHDHPGALVVISAPLDADFHHKLAELQQPVRVLETLRGFNYSKGKWVTLRLYASP
jgi:4-amino-4-deoxy-L-arabinose transferase-like glycosyltransferase